MREAKWCPQNNTLKQDISSGWVYGCEYALCRDIKMSLLCVELLMKCEHREMRGFNALRQRQPAANKTRRSKWSTSDDAVRKIEQSGGGG